MRLFGGHRRFRDSLSAYIDGQLPPGEVSQLEAHLARCRACVRDLDGLRSTVAALRGLPQEPAPRSFALTAGHVSRPARPARVPSPLLFSGMRLGGAAAALALAVVLVGDFADVGGGDGPSDRARSQEFAPMSESEAGGAAAPAPSFSLEESAGRAAPTPASTPPSQGAAPDGSGGVTVTDTDGEEAVETRTPAPPPADTVDPGAQRSPDEAAADQDEGTLQARGGDGATPGVEREDAAAQEAPDGGAGPDAVRIAEIALAAAAALLLAGSVIVKRRAGKRLP